MKSIVLPCSKTIQLRRLQGTDNPGKNEMRFQMMGTITKEIVDNKKVFQIVGTIIKEIVDNKKVFQIVGTIAMHLDKEHSPQILLTM